MPSESEELTIDPYARIAEWYDLEHDGFTDDVEMYHELLGGAAQRLAILEIGGGTGRLMAALAAAGHAVTGVEPSEAMRARCAKRLEALPERVARRTRLVSGTARELGLREDERFDVALMGLGTLGHLTTAEERGAALATLRGHLKSGGLLLLDVDIAGPRRLAEAAGRLWWQGMWRAASGEMVSHVVTGAAGREPGAVEVTHIYDAHEQGGAVRRTVTVTGLALLSRGEVELAVRHAGFVEVQMFGGYDLTPADEGSPRAIVSARKV